MRSASQKASSSGKSGCVWEERRSKSIRLKIEQSSSFAKRRNDKNLPKQAIHSEQGGGAQKRYFFGSFA